MNYIFFSIVAVSLTGSLAFMGWTLGKQSQAVLKQNQTLIDLIVSGDLPTFVSLHSQTSSDPSLTKSEYISPSDESERERINNWYVERGLGEPVHIEETNELITENELMKAAQELTGTRE
jgi:hypothetical protein